MTSSDLAWMKGEAAYEAGDTVGQGATRALHNGFVPGRPGYSAFISGFLGQQKAKAADQLALPFD